MKDQVLYWIRVPLLATLEYTIPDCRSNLGSKVFLVTFAMSIWWTAIFSYLMVWMVTLIGFTMGIPDSIMGRYFPLDNFVLVESRMNFHSNRKAATL